MAFEKSHLLQLELDGREGGNGPGKTAGVCPESSRKALGLQQGMACSLCLLEGPLLPQCGEWTGEGRPK